MIYGLFRDLRRGQVGVDYLIHRWIHSLVVRGAYRGQLRQSSPGRAFEWRNST